MSLQKFWNPWKQGRTQFCPFSLMSTRAIYVRYQRGSFAEAFAKHEDRFCDDVDKVKRWRTDLRRVANLSGWDSKNYGSERELIKVIVRCVWSKVHPRITLLDSTDKLVGIDFGKLDFLLAPEKNDVRFIGLWGMGGVGKTTLAKLIFERISHHFEVRQFLVNVRDVSARHGTLVDLQKQLLSHILKENVTQVWDEEQGTSFIRKCFSNKKVLLVVDNVDHCNQLELLAGNKSWFGEGSRIIITNRDERLLIENDIEISLKVNELTKDEALQLFSQSAFRRDWPEEDFMQLSECFVQYAKGLPLALKTMGRSLYKRNLNAWNSALDKLNRTPIPSIFYCLKISYDSLDDMEKNILLDIVFFYMGMEKGQVIAMLESCGLCGLIGIDVLVEKSLITIGRDGCVAIHDLIQEMAREIVQQESPEEPGLRSRLCHRHDIFHVFLKNTGTKAIKGIRLCLPKLEVADSSWNNEGFSKMLNLTNLEFDNISISSSPKFLPNSLRSLKWSMYPSKSLPASYIPNLLVKLEMLDSKLGKLWDGKQDLPNLKYMNLAGSKNLTTTPDFTGILNIETLVLSQCSSLVEIHPSIAVHKKIRSLHLIDCQSIESFPSEIDMDSLSILNLNCCSKLKIPKFSRGMKKLSVLSLSCRCNFENVPRSIERLQVGVWQLRSVERLYLSDANLCDGDIPDDIGYSFPSLRRLYLRGNNFASLPSTITCLSKLEYIDLSNCQRLQQLPILWATCCGSLKLLPEQPGNPLNVQRNYEIFEIKYVNCFGLVANERWNNGILSMLRPLPAQGILSEYDSFRTVSPGSNLSEWFNIQSEGDSLRVELPSDRELCGSHWAGIAVGVVFACQKNQAALESGRISYGIECSGEYFSLSSLDG